MTIYGVLTLIHVTRMLENGENLKNYRHDKDENLRMLSFNEQQI